MPYPSRRHGAKTELVIVRLVIDGAIGRGGTSVDRAAMEVCVSLVADACRPGV